MIKFTKFGEDWLNCFWAIEEKPGDGTIPPSPSPGPNRAEVYLVHVTFIYETQTSSLPELPDRLPLLSGQVFPGKK